MSTSASYSRSTAATTETRERGRVATRTRETEVSNIQENTFYKVILNPELSPEQKMDQATAIFESATSKEESRARFKEFEDFKEHLQSISEEMSKQRIRLTDTETYAELQRVYGGFNDDLNKFIEDMKPLTDITDALYTLQKEGTTRQAIDQIAADKEWEITHAQAVTDTTAKIANLRAATQRLRDDNIRLSQDKGMFGLGAIKAGSLAQIKINEGTITVNEAEIKTLEEGLVTLNTEAANRAANKVNSFEIDQLRTLLDLTSDEHTQRQANLVGSALKFVETGKERFGSIRGHLDKMVTQIEGLGDNNGNMVQIYAILNEATKRAEKSNQAKREQLASAPKPDSLIEQMKLEEERQNLDEHIGVLATASVDTLQAYGDLATEAIKIRNMEAATKKQVDSARAMHSRGIASVASQLSVVVTAVNSAAINQAQSMAGSTLTEMAKVTNAVAQKEAIRIATGRDDVNVELEAALQQLADFGDTQREATDITRDALQRMRENAAELEKLAGDVNQDTRDFVSVAADVVGGTTGEKAPTATTTTDSPFALPKL